MSDKPDELDELETDITDEIADAIHGLAEGVGYKVADIQPPTSIVRAAAVAAAQVLMAFERGYRMDTAPEELTMPDGFKPITTGASHTDFAP